MTLTPEEQEAFDAVVEVFPGTTLLGFERGDPHALEDANRLDAARILEPRARDAGWPRLRISDYEAVLPGEDNWTRFLASAPLYQLEKALDAMRRAA